MKGRKALSQQRREARTHPQWLRAFVWVLLAVFAMSTLGLALFNVR
jgi:hypothetical protein